jgi:hypothetical protein
LIDGEEDPYLRAVLVGCCWEPTDIYQTTDHKCGGFDSLPARS